MKILLIAFLYFSLPYVNSIVMYPVMRAATNIQRILHPLNPLPKVEYPKLNVSELTEQEKYDLQWYVIGKKGDFIPNRQKKVTIWSKNYVVWKDSQGDYFALDDICPHRGASLANGKIQNNCAVCPYHGYEFDKNGTLEKIPGLDFQNTPCHNLNTYSVVESNGWLYLNTIPKVNGLDFNKSEIFVEPEAENPEFSPKASRQIGFQGITVCCTERPWRWGQKATNDPFWCSRP